MIVAGVWAGVGFSNLKIFRTQIQTFWNRSGVGVWKSNSGHLCLPHASKIPKNRFPTQNKFSYVYWRTCVYFTSVIFYLQANRDVTIDFGSLSKILSYAEIPTYVDDIPFAAVA